MKTLQELQEIRDRVRAQLVNRKVCAPSEVISGVAQRHVLVCGGTGCTSGNSKIIYERLIAKLEEAGLKDEVKVIMTGCFGLCSKGPIVVVYPDDSFYTHVKPDDVDEIVSEHLDRKSVV